MKIWSAVVKGLNRITRKATIFCFILLFVVVMMQIIWRYLLAIPLPWSDEASRYLLVWVSLLAVSLTFRDDSHLRLDYFFLKFPTNVRHGLWIAFNLLAMAFVLILFAYGIPYAQGGEATNSPGLTAMFDNITVSMFPAYLCVPITAGIMLINLADYILRNYRSKELGDVSERTGQ